MDDLAELAQAIGEGNVRRVLLSAGASAALKAFNRDCEVRYAIELLKRHAGTDAIREGLIARYGISERTAYYRLADAIESLQRRPDSCSEDRDTGGSNDGSK